MKIMTQTEEQYANELINEHNYPFVTRGFAIKHSIISVEKTIEALSRLESHPVTFEHLFYYNVVLELLKEKLHPYC